MVLEHVGMVFKNVVALRGWVDSELKGFMAFKEKKKWVGGKPSDRYQSWSIYCKVPVHATVTWLQIGVKADLVPP